GMKPLITVPIQSSTPARIEKELQSARDRVEADEVWLDCLEKKDLFPGRVEKLVRHWKKMTKKKLIVVCKDLSEQGKFRGTSKEKADLLLAAADGGADYLDLGTRSGKKWIEAVVLKKKKAKVIVSFHDFKRTPSAARLKSIA